MAHKNSFRGKSRLDWGGKHSQLSIEEINTGAFLRIADATEAMAKNHVKLQAERDRLQRWYDQEHRRAAALKRSNSALRGQITKLRKRLSAASTAAQ